MSFDECNSECNTVNSSVSIRYVDGAWTTVMDEGDNNGDIVFENDDDLPIGTIITIGQDGDIQIPQPIWEWASGVIEVGNTDNIEGTVGVDCCGNVYVAAVYDSTTITFNSMSSTLSLVLPGTADPHLFVAKTNKIGIWLWAAYVTGGTDGAVDAQIITDHCGNSYVSFNAHDIVTLYNADGSSSFVRVVDGTTDVFVAKIDANGAWQWIVRVTNNDGSSIDEPVRIGFDSTCNIYVQASRSPATGTTEFYNRHNTLDLTQTVNGTFAYVAKLTTDGFWVWSASTTVAINSNEIGVTSMASDCCGNSYFAREFSSSNLTYYNADGSIFSTLPGVSDGNGIALAKIDADGDWQWVNNVYSINSLGNGAVLPDVAVDCCNNVYLSGFLDDTIATFYNSDSTEFTTIVSTLDNTFFVGCMNVDGYWTWLCRGENFVTVTNIAVDMCGNVYVGALYDSNVGQTLTLFNADESILNVTYTSSNDQDIFYGKIYDGTWLYGSTIVGGADDFDLQLVTDCCNNLYAFGNSASNFITFNNPDQTTGLTFTGQGTTNIFLAKLNDELCFPGIVQNDCHVEFKGIVQVNDNTTSELPISEGRFYYYDQNTNQLTTVCTEISCSQPCVCTCCKKLRVCRQAFGIGLPNNLLCIV